MLDFGTEIFNDLQGSSRIFNDLPGASVPAISDDLRGSSPILKDLHFRPFPNVSRTCPETEPQVGWEATCLIRRIAPVVLQH